MDHRPPGIISHPVLCLFVLLHWWPSFYLYPTTIFWCVYFALFPPSHYHHAQLRFCILVKDSYHFAFLIPTPLVPNECDTFERGGYSSCYTYKCRCYGTTIFLPLFVSWQLVHFPPPSYNSLWGTHLLFSPIVPTSFCVRLRVISVQEPSRNRSYSQVSNIHLCSEGPQTKLV